MSQGNDFANYSAASNAGTGGSEEVWFVAVASDDIKQMTIDQLDEAFRLGIITGETPVWTEGMEAWSPLAQVADLDGDSGAAQEEPVASRHDYGQSHGHGGNGNGNANGHAGNAHPGNGHPSNAHPGNGHPSNGHPSNGHPSNGHPGNTGSFGIAPGAGFGAVTLQSVQHSFAPGPSSVAPVTASYAPSAYVGQSSAPVVIGGDEDVPAPKRGGGFRPARWVLVGAAAVVAVGVVAYNNLSSSVASAGTEAAAPALAARPYEGADGADRGASASARTNHAAAASAGEAAVEPAEAPAAAAQGTTGAAAVAGAAAAAATTARAALVASSDDEAGEPPAKKGADKDSLRSTFSKSLTKKGSARATKVKPRKAASRASTKSRSTKAAKKPTVVRSQSAFDPLNDSLP